MKSESNVMARQHAQRLKLQYPLRTVRDIAQSLNIEIICDAWVVASGRVIFLAECSLQPPEIRLNQAALGKMAARARTAPGLRQGQAHGSLKVGLPKPSSPTSCITSSRSNHPRR